MPVLVGGAKMPTVEELPEPLALLTQRHAFMMPTAPNAESCAPLLRELELVVNDPFRDDVVKNRDDPYVYVSFHRFRNEPQPDWRPYNCRIANRFQQLLDEIYEHGAEFLPMYAYGQAWVLCDADEGQRFAHRKMIEGGSGVRVVDGRLLSEVGIQPGMRLLVVRPDDQEHPLPTEEQHDR
jgi:hypothetical protein